MERLKDGSDHKSVITSSNGSTLIPGIVISATLMASNIQPYGVTHQLPVFDKDAKITTSMSHGHSKISTYSDTSQINGSKSVEVEMSTFSREELDAKLALNKSEIQNSQNQNFSAIEKLLIEVKGEITGIRGELTGLRGELTGNKEGILGQIDGLKSSISTMQWMVGTVLAMIGIAVAILAIPEIDKII